MSLFIPCYVDVMYPEVGVSVVRVLRRLGVEVSYPAGQTCCGQPAFNSGYFDKARGVAGHFLDVFEDEESDYIVCPSGSCTAMASHYYAMIFEDLPEKRERAGAVGRRVREFSDFIVNVLGVTDLGATLDGRAVFHAGCHQRRELGILEEPRELMQNVGGLEVLDWKNEELCCGFGGTFAVKMPDVSAAMADEKLAALEEAGADTLVSCDSSCLMHLGGRLGKLGRKTRVMHLAEVLDPGFGHAVGAVGEDA
ncbi:(Fe-S)-binding protein [Rubrobacter indicoceani]|uniref:(Fe-S)-binding protein n=1 Tax=Rubrobacter indicoceani TaxID=2051957 RepID=UPI00308403C6